MAFPISPQKSVRSQYSLGSLKAQHTFPLVSSAALVASVTLCYHSLALGSGTSCVLPSYHVHWQRGFPPIFRRHYSKVSYARALLSTATETILAPGHASYWALHGYWLDV